MLKRAGLDYWEHVHITYYDSLEDFFKKTAGGAFFYITKFGQKNFTSFDYSEPSKEYYFIFGGETTGLPKEVIQNNLDTALRIPMNEKIGSLNLSNTAAILIYEALRQQDYLNLK
jgi:tRNA (cytidine/uridine-2'-O-)-methyltransferase